MLCCRIALVQLEKWRDNAKKKELENAILKEAHMI